MSTLGSIVLPDDLQWADEYTSWKVGQVIRPSLSGALIIQEAAMQAGRPVTLQSQDLGGGTYVAPIRLDTLEALRALEETAGAAPLVLEIPAAGGGSRTMTVKWRRTGEPAIEARPIKFIVPAEAADYFFVTLRLIQV